MNKVKLGEICKICSSKRIFESEYRQNGIPFIRGLEITDGSLMKDNVKYECYISKERYLELKEKNGVPQKGDILITAVGTIGNLCYIDKDKEFYFKDGNVIWFKDFDENVYSKYLFYFMKSPYFNRQLECAMIGAVQKALTMVMLSEIELELPKYEEQIQIVNILDAIDSKIENNNKINAELESMAKTIYDYWFLQFEFPNEDGKPYKSSGGKMVWNEELKREIPEGWEVSDLSKLCVFNNGINYDKEELGDKDYKIVNVRNISSTTLLLDKSDLDNICLQSNQADKYLVEDDDILIARSGTPGAVRLLESDVNDIIYCGFIIRCKPKNKEQRYYLTYSLKLLEGSNATKTGGSILQNVSQETLKQISVCIPPNEIVKKYNESINDIFRKMQNVIEENRELTSLRDFLLPMLMNGQISIKRGQKSAN